MSNFFVMLMGVVGNRKDANFINNDLFKGARILSAIKFLTFNND